MSKTLLLCTSGLFTSLWIASAACYGDSQRGQILHDEDCRVCHDSKVYTRENRKIQTLKQLVAQVDRCQTGVGVEWDAVQVDDVAAYLNDRFYRFGSDTE